MAGLIFAGSQLEDGYTLLDYDIEPEKEAAQALHRRMLLHKNMSMSPMINLNINLVLHLRGGGYPQYILTKAAEFNDDNETIEMTFYPLYVKILL